LNGHISSFQTVPQSK
jgi:hypothetical protein